MPHASSASLSGWYVISLRPLDQHAPVRREAARWGARTFALSTLRLEALDAGAAYGAALACPIVIVTSPAAARFAAAHGRLRARRGQHWFAVGPGTAAALRRVGIARVEVPPQGADAQALLAHPALASLPGVDVALLTAPGGRGLLGPGLAARGARVHQVDLYRRRAAPPRPARPAGPGAGAGGAQRAAGQQWRGAGHALAGARRPSAPRPGPALVRGQQCAPGRAGARPGIRPSLPRRRCPPAVAAARARRSRAWPLPVACTRSCRQSPGDERPRVRSLSFHVPSTSTSTATATAAARPRRLPAALWLLVLIAVVLAAVWLWRLRAPSDSAAEAEVDLSPHALDARLLQAEATLSTLRRSQEALNQRLTDNSARTGLLRDEVLGITQRSALIEDSVRELANNRREGEAALRLDEAELLLTLASQRLQLAGDLPGAIRATELAEGVLSSLRDPALLNLRQSLAQELSALRAMPKDPRTLAAGELDALEAVLPQLSAGGPARPDDAGGAPRGASGFERLLDALVQIRPSGEQDLLTPADRNTGEAALALEIALARTALERRDAAGFRTSLGRIDSWLRRLYADGPLLRERRQRLKKLEALPLSLNLPVAGSTLEQLHQLQRSRQSAP